MKIENKKRQHWTAKNSENLRYFVAADFVEQLRDCIDLRGFTQRQLADKLQVNESRISQVFNDPGNLTLNTMVEWTHALGFKTSIVVYDAGDLSNVRGSLSGSIFAECWRKVGAPLEWPNDYVPCEKWDFSNSPGRLPEKFDEKVSSAPSGEYALAA